MKSQNTGSGTSGKPAAGGASDNRGAGAKTAGAKPASGNSASGDSRQQDKPHIQGEGDYESAREYNKDLKEFIDSGKVDEAARASAPRSKREADAMEEAERAGKARAKEEDRLLRKPGH